MCPDSNASPRLHWSSTARLVAYRDNAAAALQLASTGCSPAGLGIMMAKGLPIAIRIDKVPLKPAILIKQEALSVGGDAAYSREVAALNCEHTDMVLLLSPKQLPRFLLKLEMQPFGLKRLAAALRTIGDPRLQRGPLSLRGRTLPLGTRTYIMGILNATPDSFSDGGLHYKEQDAIAHAMRMVGEGADIIDIGGESTRPGAGAVDASEEISRVIGAIEYLVRNSGAIISVDTMKPEVARACLDAGAHMVNDVSGLAAGPEIAKLCTDYGAGLALMHMRGTPRNMMQHTDYTDVVKDVISELLLRVDLALTEGVPGNAIMLDPGFGFSKKPGHNIELLARLPEFANMGYPIIVGLSRKSTIGLVTGVKEANLRVPGSLAALTAAILGGADIVRVHDVAESLQAAKMADALMHPVGNIG